jgi:hypothetical protein
LIIPRGNKQASQKGFHRMNILPKLRIWCQSHASESISSDVTHPVWFSVSSPTPSAQPLDRAVGIRPIVPRGAFIGVAIVPAELQATIAINGTPIGSGLHGLRHADRLDLNGHSIWIAASSSVEITAYDPAIDGDKNYCFITKAPLAAGQAIVRCPGFRGKACNVIYLRDAWERAMQTPTRLRCANCGFRPDEAEWQPPQHEPRRRLDDILATIVSGRA